MFKRLLSALTGKNVSPSPAGEAPAPAQPASPAKEELITAYDAYGRELKITRSEWREKIFLPALQQKWNEPAAGRLLSAPDCGSAAALVCPTWACTRCLKGGNRIE